MRGRHLPSAPPPCPQQAGATSLTASLRESGSTLEGMRDAVRRLREDTDAANARAAAMEAEAAKLAAASRAQAMKREATLALADSLRHATGDNEQQRVDLEAAVADLRSELAGVVEEVAHYEARIEEFVNATPGPMASSKSRAENVAIRQEAAARRHAAARRAGGWQ